MAWPLRTTHASMHAWYCSTTTCTVLYCTLLARFFTVEPTVKKVTADALYFLQRTTFFYGHYFSEGKFFGLGSFFDQ